eukprot:12041278-Ditylum_brightwellii.AAC.1
MESSCSQNKEIGNDIKWKKSQHTHFCVLNPNSISLADNTLALKLLYEYITEQNTGYIGFMEINLDTMCGNVTKIFKTQQESTFLIVMLQQPVCLHWSNMSSGQ